MATNSSTSSSGRSRGRFHDPSVEVSSGWVRRLFRYWPVTMVVLVLSVLAGYTVGTGKTPVYTSEERIAVGYADNNLSAGATSGYPSAAEMLASNYARYVNDQYLAGTSAAGNTSVVGTAIDGANVIRVIATSADPAAAKAGAKAASDQLVSKINDGTSAKTPDAIKEQYDAAVDKWSQYNSSQISAQGQLGSAIGRGADAGTISQLQSELAAAQAAYAKQDLIKSGLSSQYQNALNSGGAAQLTVVAPAGSATTNHQSLVTRYALVGAAVGLVLALLLASVLESLGIGLGFSRRRRKSGSGSDWLPSQA